MLGSITELVLLEGSITLIGDEDASTTMEDVVDGEFKLSVLVLDMVSSSLATAVKEAAVIEVVANGNTTVVDVP